MGVYADECRRLEQARVDATRCGVCDQHGKFNIKLFAGFLFNFYIYFLRVKFRKLKGDFSFRDKEGFNNARMCDSKKKKTRG